LREIGWRVAHGFRGAIRQRSDEMPENVDVVHVMLL
jgi:hypothetical protein